MKPEILRCTVCGSYGSEPCFGGITGRPMALQHAPNFRVSLAAFNSACKCPPLPTEPCNCSGAMNRIPGKPGHGAITRPPP